MRLVRAGIGIPARNYDTVRATRIPLKAENSYSRSIKEAFCSPDKWVTGVRFSSATGGLDPSTIR